MRSVQILPVAEHDHIHGSSRLRLSWRNRDVIFNLQIDRKNIVSQDASVFDDYNLINVKLYLNSEFYPYDLNIDFGRNALPV